ncbi:MAG: hypothetical protein HY053_03725, partial [Proteobacteria bacterium]|nr:hypothetical protein [Pseudomonadota bacterium]
PVANLNGLAAPTNTTIVATPTLPEYDSAAPGADATSYTQTSVKIDDSFTITYGISSNDAAFQNLILGLRWAYQATQETTDAAFTTDMDNARSLLDTGITSMRSLHGQVASNLAQFEATKKIQTDFLSDALGQIDDIQNADPAKVATEISFAQAQLQASYSVTAKIASLSLVNFLSS